MSLFNRGMVLISDDSVAIPYVQEEFPSTQFSRELPHFSPELLIHCLKRVGLLLLSALF
jgi:hypothetical protein